MTGKESKESIAEETLRTCGVRRTSARLTILNLLGERHDHPTAEQIAATVRERGERVSVATLYQNLNKLVESGAIGRLKGPDGRMHFDAIAAPHHHLICQRCGCIVDVALERMLPAMAMPWCPHTGQPLYDWSLQSMQIELKGLCPACR